MFMLTDIPDLQNQLQQTFENCAEKIKILEVSLTTVITPLLGMEFAVTVDYI
jgi:hypothetical protein